MSNDVLINNKKRFKQFMQNDAAKQWWLTYIVGREWWLIIPCASAVLAWNWRIGIVVFFLLSLIKYLLRLWVSWDLIYSMIMGTIYKAEAIQRKNKETKQ